jgi:hypothetical protein
MEEAPESPCQPDILQDLVDGPLFSLTELLQGPNCFDVDRNVNSLMDMASLESLGIGMFPIPTFQRSLR